MDAVGKFDQIPADDQFPSALSLVKDPIVPEEFGGLLANVKTDPAEFFSAA